MTHRLGKALLFHLIPPVVLFAAVVLLGGWASIVILAGFVTASFLFDLDHLLYVYVAAPQHEVSQRVRQYMREREWSAMLNYIITRRHDFRQLTLHNVLFQLFLLVGAFYVLSSSGSLFAKSFIVGLFAHSVVDQFGDLAKEGTIAAWLWVVGRQIPLVWQQVYVMIMAGATAFLLLLLAW